MKDATDEIKCDPTCEYFFLSDRFIAKCKCAKLGKGFRVLPKDTTKVPDWCIRMKE